MSIPFFICVLACVGCGVYAAYRNNLERNWSEYHIAHGPRSGCVDCQDK